jgi:hypothetical protein
MSEVCSICLISEICDPLNRGHAPCRLAYLANCGEAKSVDDVREVKT